MNYIIFSHDISGIGGAQQYILRKAKHLARGGYNVLIISARISPILYKGFDAYKFAEFPEIVIPCYLFSKRTVRIISGKIEDFITTNIQKNEKTIFESVTIQTGTWAELVASTINAFSFIYDVNCSPLRTKNIALFASYKLQQMKLVGCSKHGLKRVFNNYEDFYNSRWDHYINIPFQKQEIFSSSLPIYKPRGYDFGFLTISRVAKPYLQKLIDESAIVASLLPEKRFLLTFVLDKTKGLEFRLIKKKARQVPPNLSIEFVGPFVPLPSFLFENHDIFIGVGTASLHAIAWGLPTIIMNSKSEMSAGILGIDVDFFGYSPNYSKPASYYLFRLVQDALLMKTAKERGKSLFLESFEEKTVLEKFDKFIGNLDFLSPGYFDFSSLVLTKMENIKKMFLSIFKSRILVFLVNNSLSRTIWKLF